MVAWSRTSLSEPVQHALKTKGKRQFRLKQVLAQYYVRRYKTMKLPKQGNIPRTRMDWEERVKIMAQIPGEFRRTYRMELATFNYILETLRPHLTRDNERASRSSKGAVIPELRLSMALRFVAGNSCLSMRPIPEFRFYFSTPSFDPCCLLQAVHTLTSIRCTELPEARSIKWSGRCWLLLPSIFL